MTLLPPVSIRPIDPADAGLVTAAILESRAQLSIWMPWCHPGYSAADTAAFLETQPAHFQKGTEYTFAIVDASGAFLGCCGLNHIDPLNRLANLGYWVRTGATGRGVASRAGRLLVEWASEHTQLGRIEIVAAVSNQASQRVAEKLGAVREGVLRQRLVLAGVPHDAVIYSLVREGDAISAGSLAGTS